MTGPRRNIAPWPEPQEPTPFDPYELGGPGKTVFMSARKNAPVWDKRTLAESYVAELNNLSKHGLDVYYVWDEAQETLTVHFVGEMD